MAIEVIKPGLATSVQDAGRPGYYNIGIPISGGLDQYSLRAANLLVGNEEGAAALEATLLGPSSSSARRYRRRDRSGSDAEDQRRDAAAQRILRGARGRSPFLRFHEGGCTHLCRNRRWDRCAAGSGQPLDLCARRAWRICRAET